MDQYSRNRTVAAITSYYKLLVRMYLHHDDLVFPPPGGWPHIDQQNFGFMNKTDDIIDLLRHLPYVKPVPRFNNTQIYPWTVCADYQNEDLKWEGQWTNAGINPEDGEFATLPAHIVTIFCPLESDGTYFFLDTKRNTVTMAETDGGGPELKGYNNLAQKDVDLAQEDKWRAAPTYLIQDCFEGLEEWLRDIPSCPPKNQNEWGGDPQIFEAHGWPTPAYDKIACLRALREIPGYGVEDNFPTLDELDANFPDLAAVEDDLPVL